MIKSFQKAALLVAVIALAGSAGFFWQFLSHGNISGRAIIPPTEIKHDNGFRYVWRVPAELRAAPWYRAELRITENSKPLPFRVEDADAVSAQGGGRFRAAPFAVGAIQQEFIWFSSSDNSDPVKNGRSYELAVARTNYRFAILSAIALMISVLAGFVVVTATIWSRLPGRIGQSGSARSELARYLGICLAILAVGVVTQSWRPARIAVSIPIPAARLIQRDHLVSYRLPRWIGQGMAQEFIELYEDGKPIKQSGAGALQTDNGKGGFYCTSDDGPVQICFRAAAGSNPAINGRSYTAKVPLFPMPRVAPRLAVCLGAVGLLLFIYAPEFAATRIANETSRLDTKKKSTDWRWALLIVGVAKLWVIGGDEILAQTYDAHGYAKSAIGLVWGADFIDQPPGFSMLAGIVSQFGIPWRLALEILYLAACASLAIEIVSFLGSRLVGFLLFTAMAWHPWTLSAFHDFWTYPFVLLLSVALLSVIFRILGRPSNEWTWPIFFWEGCILFFWEWSRTEDPLVYGTWALFAALAWGLTRLETNPASWRRRVALLALPVLLVISLSTTVRIANFLHYGVFAKSRMTSPGLTALMKALYRIKPESDLRFAPVTRQSLQMACEASPTLRQFKNQLLDPLAHNVRIGEGITKVRGEFGPWLNMLLLASVKGDNRDANQAMLAAASEINDALGDGRLPARRASYPLDPNWRLWLPDLAPSIVSSLEAVSSIRRWNSAKNEITGGSFIEHDFDVAANRRTAIASSPSLLIEGVVRRPLPAIDSVAVTDQDGKLLSASPLKTEGIDGRTVFYLRSPMPHETNGFNLAFFRKGELQFSEKSREISWWATNQYATASNSVSLDGAAEKFDYSYQVVISGSERRTRMTSWEPRSEHLCKILSWSAVLAALLIILWSEPWDYIRLARGISFLVLTAAWLFGRAALYGLIQANMSYPIDRYMRCISPLFPLVLVLTTAMVAAFLKMLLYKKRRSQ